jgi:LysM domain/Fungal chitosanase of glycosyl hydrolase group 75
MYYTVKPGESLHHICHRFQVKQEELMAANQMLASTVTPGQLLFIPFYSVRKSLNIETGEVMPWEKLNENDDWRQVPSPQETKPRPDEWPPKREWRKGHKIAVFKAKDIDENIPIYNSRAAYFFMSKMAVELTQCYSICDHSVRPCGKCFKSESTPFYVMPHNTSWVSLGDYGVVINTRTKKATYAICADWGPTHESISTAEGTKFVGKIGEGSIHLGKQLDIKDIKPNPKKAFEPFGIVYIIFPGSANGVRTIKSVEEINKDAHHAFSKWGGWEQAQLVLKEHYNITM